MVLLMAVELSKVTPSMTLMIHADAVDADPAEAVTQGPSDEDERSECQRVAVDDPLLARRAGAEIL